MVASGESVFVLRKNVFARCLDLYPGGEWEKMMQGLREKLSAFNPKHAAFLREFCRGTQEIEMDANGRILLPRRMLEEVGIDKEMVLAAQDTLIQIWDVQAYADAAVSGEELGALAEEIFEGGKG